MKFRILTKGIYLATCSHSPAHEGIVNALKKYEEDLIEYGNAWDLWQNKIIEIKKLFSTLINASPDEITLHYSVSSAFSSLVSSFTYKQQRKVILTTDMEFPTVSYILMTQRKFGAKIKVIKSKDYNINVDEYHSLIKKFEDKLLLTTAVHVSSLNGLKQDIRGIAKLTHEAGGYIFVDAYQSAGNSFIDVKKMDIDFLSTGTLKYLLGIPGLAFLYVKNDLIESLEPSCIGWLSQKDPFLFGPEELNYKDNADRFQQGTWTIPAIYVAIEGLKIILERGINYIEEKITQLTRYAIALGEEVGLKVITPHEDERRGAIVSFIMKNPQEIEMKLKSLKIYTSSRGSVLRIAPHFFNSKEDIEKVIEVIKEVKKDMI